MKAVLSKNFRHRGLIRPKYIGGNGDGLKLKIHHQQMPANTNKQPL
jgi:hypothetical protein